MINVADISDVVSVLSPSSILSLLNFFMPGLMFWCVFSYRTNGNFKDTRFTTIVLSIVISYILNSIAGEIKYLRDDKRQGLFILAINLTAIILSFIISAIYKSFLKKRKISRTLSDDLWDDILTQYDKNKVLYVNVYLNDKRMVHGQLSQVSENENPDIIVEMYCICVLNDQGELVKEPKFNEYAKYYIKNDQITSIEFYQE